MTASDSGFDPHRKYQLLVGGEWIDGAEGGYEIVNPANGELTGVAPEASVQQAHDAARAAQEAFPAWSRTTPEHRSELLARAAVAVKEHAEALVPLVIAETGCTAMVGKSMQVPQVFARFERYAR